MDQSFRCNPTQHPLLKKNSQAVKKLGANIQKQEVKSEGHPHKLDDFETPSFETSVQSIEFATKYIDMNIMNKVAKRNQEDDMNESFAILH